MPKFSVATMTNKNRDSTSFRRAGSILCVDVVTDWTVSILLSFGTAFSMYVVTAKLCNLYVEGQFMHGFDAIDAGVQLAFLFLLGLPTMFIIALIIWRVSSWRSRNLIRSLITWAVALSVALGTGYLSTLAITNNWETKSYLDFENKQGQIVFGFPFVSMVTYLLVLLLLRRLHRTAVQQRP
jgi:hypothetical protein